MYNDLNDLSMKKSIAIFLSIVCVGAAFWAGRLSRPDIPANNADGILAYQHYYECAEKALKDVTISDAELAKDMALAQKHLEDYVAGHIMEWPEVCDQRDKLSDIIRKYAKEENSNIIDYVSEYFDNPFVINGWRYSY